MSDIAIHVDGLGKKYRLGERAPHHRFSEVLQGLPRAIWGAARSGPAENREFWALKDASFEVRQGEVVGVIGRNGAGKSTLLKILSRITEPTIGRFGLRGRVSSLLEVGAGFQPDLTGRENVYLSGVLLGLTRKDVARQFDRIVEFADMTPFLDTPVKRYSSGMYVRLGFAVAAHLQSEILIVDEVLAVGDAEFQKKCLGKMSETARGGRTVLLVSHNMRSIDALCRRCLLLDRGDIVANGPTREVVKRYFDGPPAGDPSREPQAAHPPSDIELTAAALTDASGQATNWLPFGAPFLVTTRWRLNRVMHTACYAMRIFDAGGALMFACNTFAAPDLAPKTPGEFELVCRMPTNPLIPGSYYMEWMVTHGPGFVNRYEAPGPAFRIEETPGDPRFRYTNFDKPAFAVPAQWELRSAGA